MNPATTIDTETLFQPLGSGQSLPQRWRWHYGHVVVTLILAAIFFLANHAPLWHTDIWGHLKYGQWIDQHHELPTQELFLKDFTAGVPYTPFAWMSQWIFYQVYQLGTHFDFGGTDPERQMAGGVAALRFLHALLVVARFAVMYLAFLRVTQSMAWSVVGLLVMAGLSFANLGVLRPQVFGELGFALLLWSLSDPVPTKWAIYGMPLVFALWANLHGSFIVGLVLVLGIIGGQMLRIVRTAGVRVRAYWRDDAFRMLMRLLWLAIMAVGLCNPQFFNIFTEIWNFSAHANLASMDEWKSLDWHSPFGFAFLVSIVLVVLTYVAGIFGEQTDHRSDQTFGPISLGQLLLLLILGWQVYQHQRMMLWWIMIMPWICMPVWANITRHRLRYPVTALWTPKTWSQALRPLLLVAVIVWIAFLWSTLGFVWSQAAPQPLHQALQPGTPYLLVKQLQYPAQNIIPELAAWLRRNAGSGPFPGRLFATETQGEYLLWALPNELCPPIYTHVHLVPPEHWRDIMIVKSGVSGWRSILDRWRVNLMIFEPELHPDLRLAVYLDNATWTVVLDETGDARKKDPRSRHLIAVRATPVGLRQQPKP